MDSFAWERKQASKQASNDALAQMVRAAGRAGASSNYPCPCRCRAAPAGEVARRRVRNAVAVAWMAG